MHHGLSHHVKEPKKLAVCRQVEVELIQAFGGFRHGQHLAFNRPYLQELNQELTAAPGTNVGTEKKIPMMGQEQQPLCNLYTSMLRQGGVDIDRFSTATGTLEGLV